MVGYLNSDHSTLSQGAGKGVGTYSASDDVVCSTDVGDPNLSRPGDCVGDFIAYWMPNRIRIPRSLSLSLYIYASPPPQDQYFDSLARCSCVRALLSMLMWRSYRTCWCGGATGIQKIFWLPWQMFMCQSIVFHVDHHLTSSVHIITFSF